MRNKLFLSFIFVISLISNLTPRLSARTEERSIPENSFYEEGSAPAMSSPVTLPLSRIPQRKELSIGEEEEERIWNAGEKELQKKTISIPKTKSQSFLQRDEATAAKPVLPPSVLANFPGLPCTVQGDVKGQPDSNIAVGANRIIVTVNRTIAIYTKTGKLRFQTSTTEWFSRLPEVAGSRLIDARVLYDSYNNQNHFIVTCMMRRRGASYIMMSVSKTSDPEGDWSFWALDMQRNGTKFVNLYADFPRVGVDSSSIYLGAGMWTFSLQFRYEKIRILKKSEVYSFGPVSWHDFWNMTDATGQTAIHIEPAQTYGKSNIEYLINTRSDAGNMITLWTITNADSKPRLIKKAVPVDPYTAAVFAAQKNSSVVLVSTTEGTGVLKVVSRNGFLYASHAITQDWGSGPVSAIRFYQLDTNGNLLQQTTYGSDGVNYYMPTLAVNQSGDVVLAFSRSSQSQYAGLYFAGRKASDPRNRFSKSVPVQVGLGPYNITFAGSNIGKWGDYQGIALAPDNTFWIYGQYAVNSDCWGTQIGRVSY
jgi:hypothetical protein